MSDQMFDRLRTIVLATIRDRATSGIFECDLVPIEQTVDGWFCLLRSGHVAHVGVGGAHVENIEAVDRTTALIGRLARQFPLATWFVPRAAHAELCPSCNGAGAVPGLPENLRARVVCRCGGLGWVPVS